MKYRSVLLIALLAPLSLVMLGAAPSVLMGTRLLGAGTADTWGHTWGYWWMADSLLHGGFPFSDAPLRWPDGQVWWIIDFPVALLLVPVTLLFDASVSYNLAILGHVSLGAAGFFLWLRSRGVRETHAGCAALSMTISPFVRGAVTSGVPEALSVLLVPLFLLLLERALRDERSRGFAVGAGLMGAFLVLDGAYGAVVGALAGVWVVTEFFWEEERSRRAALLVRAAVVAIPAACALFLLRMVLAASAHPTLDQNPSGLSESLPWWPVQLVGGTDLTSFFVPAVLLPSHIPAPTAHRHVVYIGVVLLLAACGAARERTARGPLFVALIAGLLALGPELRVWGNAVEGLSLPGVWLWDAGARNLYRVAGLVPLASIMALALAWGRRKDRAGRFLYGLWFLILVEWFMGSPIPLRLPTTDNPVGEIEIWIAEDSQEGAVLDLPFEHEGTAARGTRAQLALHLQTEHGRPIASGLYPPAFGTSIPAPLIQLDRVIVQARRFEHQARRGGRGLPPTFTIPPVPAEQEREMMRHALQSSGFRFVTLDLEAVPSVQRDGVFAWVSGCFGESSMRSDTRHVWVLGESSAEE